MTEAPRREGVGSGRWARLPWFLLGLLALAYTAEHSFWVAGDGGSPLDEHSHEHALRAMLQWRAIIGDGGLNAWLWPGYYPPGLFWVSFLGLWVLGPSLATLIQVQALYTGALVLGVGLLVGRSFTPLLGLAAGSLALSFPMFWFERSRIMLANPQAGILVLAVALLPLPGQSRWWMGLVGGVVMGLAVLTHTSNVFPALAAAAVHLFLGLRLLWRRPPGAWRELGHGTLYWLLAATSAVWYQAALPDIMEMRRAILEQYPDTIALGGVAGIVAWFKHSFLYASHAWALLFGLPLLPWTLRRPLVLVSAVGVCAVFCGILTFPQIHERYFLPAAPLLLVLIVAPVGLLSVSTLRELRWLGHAASLVLLALGLRFTLGPWLFQVPMSRTGLLDRDGTFSAWPLTSDLDEALSGLRARPRRWVHYAPRPLRGIMPLRAAAEAILADLEIRRAKGEPCSNPGVLALIGRDKESDLLDAELVALGPEAGRVVPSGSSDWRRTDCEPCYAVFSAPSALSRSEVAKDVVAAGFENIVILNVSAPADADFTLLVVAGR